jgi:hypothetical protein
MRCGDRERGFEGGVGGVGGIGEMDFEGADLWMRRCTADSLDCGERVCRTREGVEGGHSTRSQHVVIGSVIGKAVLRVK